MCKQHCRLNFRQDIIRSGVLPRVLVDLASLEPCPVCSLLTEYFCPLFVAQVVQEQRSTLAARDVLRLVETLRRHLTKGPELPSVPRSAETMCVVLNEYELVVITQRLEVFHVAGNAPVVHRHDRDRPFGDEGPHCLWADVERVWVDIGEDRPKSHLRERVGGRRKGEVRHDDLRVGIGVEQQGCHFERVGAGRREEHGRTGGQRLQALLHPLTELAIASEAPAADHLAHVLELALCGQGSVERNETGVHCVPQVRPVIPPLREHALDAYCTGPSVPRTDWTNCSTSDSSMRFSSLVCVTNECGGGLRYASLQE